MKYRPEIDGLRAIAVILVVFFHAGFKGFEGGFVGVDIFFVISGYLITGIILEKSTKERFNFLDFYQRRMQRLMPAILLVMLVSVPFAIFCLNPIYLKDFGQSLIGSSTFTSNILFFLESGYFDYTAELKPLLHTWSLAVEVHFYLLFPLIFLKTWNIGVRSNIATLSFLFFISLGLHFWGMEHYPYATFYFLPTRLWEFLLGAFASVYLGSNLSVSRPKVNQFLSLLGFALIFYSIVTFKTNLQLSNSYPIAPTLGAALIISFAKPGVLIHKILRFSPLVALGLISYSLYLFHYPVITFARYLVIGKISTGLMLLLCLLSIVLAIASWRWIEQPFRYNRSISKARFNQITIIGLFTLMVVGFTMHHKNRFADSYWINFMSEVKERPTSNKWYCLVDGQYNETQPCIRGEETEIPEYALIGDSHAFSISHELSSIFEKRKVSFVQYTKESCPAIFNIHRSVNNSCAEYIQNVVKDITDKGIKNVILASYWSYYSNTNQIVGAYKSHVRFGGEMFSAGDTKLSEKESFRENSVIMGYQEFIEYLIGQNINVYTFLPIPSQNVPILDEAMRLSTSSGIVFPQPSDYETHLALNKKVLELFETLSKANKMTLLGNLDVLCPYSEQYSKRACINNYNGEFLYLDNNHLTEEGAKLFLKGTERILFEKP
ncbi:MAG: acyltransferase [Cytophagia bacterium]|nr:acyltransferase [Cytophagia bacterium]